MHKLAQPVKLWYLGSFFRQEKPQAGRYRQFWQVGAEAIGSDDPAVDAELIVLLHDAAGRARACAALRLRLGSLGSLDARAEYRERLAGLPARARRPALAARCASASTSTRCAPSTPRTPAPRRSCATRRCCSTALSAEDPEHFDEVCARLRAAGIDYELDGTLVRGLDYYTRTIFEFTSDALGAQSGVGGGGRYDGLIELLGGPPTPGMGWAAGIERMLLAAGERPRAAGRSPTSSSPTRTARVEAFALAAEARAAGLAVQLELAGRSLKGQLKQADRAGARYVAIVGADGTQLRDMDSGEQEAVESAAAVVARVMQGTPRRMKHAPRRQRLPRRLGRRPDRRALRHRGPRRRLGAPPPRPRRADLHRPARPLGARAARLPPAGLGRRLRRGRGPALRARRLRRGRGRQARARRTSTRTSPPARSRSTCARCERLAASETPPFPSTRTRRSTRCCACSTACSTCAASTCARRWSCATTVVADDARRPRRARLPGDRDADPHALDARGRARLPRAQPPAAGLVVRAAAVAAAVQAAADDGRLRALLPDRPLLPRRGPARRPPARVHPARRRDVLRRRGRRHRDDRGRDERGVRGRPASTCRAAVAAHALRRGDAALRLRPARHALRPGDRRRLRRRCAAASSRSSSRSWAAAAWCARSTPARARCRARSSTGSTRSSSATAARRSRGASSRTARCARRSRSSWARTAWPRPSAELRRVRGRPAAVRRRPAARRGRGARRAAPGARAALRPHPRGRPRRAVGRRLPDVRAQRRRAAGAPSTIRSPRRAATSPIPGAMRSRGYDLILDGWELGGGSIRINTPEVQEQVFKVIGMSEEEGRRRFGFLLDALQLRRPAARRHRAGHRPRRGDARRARLDPRRHRLPQDGLRRRPADRRAGPRRRPPAARARGPFDRRSALVGAQESARSADTEGVDKISLPFRIVLVVFLVFAVLWFVVLRPKPAADVGHARHAAPA